MKIYIKNKLCVFLGKNSGLVERQIILRQKKYYFVRGNFSLNDNSQFTDSTTDQKVCGHFKIVGSP